MERKNGVTTYHLEDKLDFGKHKGLSIKEVLELNPDYIIWANKQIYWFRVDDSVLKRAYEIANENLDRKFKRFNNRCFNYYHNEPDPWDVDIYGYSIWD